MGLSFIHGYFPVSLPDVSMELPLNGRTEHHHHSLLCTPRASSPMLWPIPVPPEHGLLGVPQLLHFSQAGGPHPYSGTLGSAPSARGPQNRMHPRFNNDELCALMDIGWHAGERSENRCFKCLCAVGHLMLGSKMDQVIL